MLYYTQQVTIGGRHLGRVNRYCGSIDWVSVWGVTAVDARPEPAQPAVLQRTIKICVGPELLPKLKKETVELFAPLAFVQLSNAS